MLQRYWYVIVGGAPLEDLKTRKWIHKYRFKIQRPLTKPKSLAIIEDI